MSRLVIDGKAPLDETTKEKLLAEAIPYRLAFIEMALTQGEVKDHRDNAVMETAIVTGRILLDFLGLGIKRGALVEDQEYKIDKKTGLTDDVKATDLGGTFVKPECLDESVRQVLAAFHIGASKATAHLTVNSGHQLTPPVFVAALAIIHHLVLSHVLNVGK